MSIPTIPPPAGIDPELARWLLQLQIEVAGALEDSEQVTRLAKAELAQARLELIAIKAFVGMP